ncbi:MAG: 1-phosphofructokinase [Clostridiales bacterium]|nr:1-phosphofructokinase [Clostridiales bacterium]
MILTVTLNAAIDKRYEINDFQIGKVNRVGECTYSAGGKGLNVARVAAIAGEEVVATGFVGGHTGSLIEQKARESGIETDFIHIEGESRTCINIFDTASMTQTEILEGGATVTESDIERMIDKYYRLLKRADIVTISGSVPNGVGSSVYRTMISLAKKAGKPVLLDTSGSLLRDCITAAPTLIKPNQDEIEQLIEKKIETREELIDQGLKLHEKGISYIIISLGAEGSVMISPSGVYQAEVPEVKVVNTVGCGDSMLAGFAVGLRKHWEDEEILRAASAISAANAMRAETGFYLPKDYKAIYHEVKITKIKHGSVN